MFVTNEFSSDKDGNKLIKKFIKPKTRKLSKFPKLSKFQKWLSLKNCQKIEIYLKTMLQKNLVF